MHKAFLSHVSAEAQLAEKLKDWIETTFAGQVEIFVSSVSDDLPAGSKWLDKIDAALDACEILLILCSPHSIYRPWVNFEAGCGWIKRVPILPICHAGLAESELPQPLGSFQALALTDKNFPEKLIKSIAKHFGIEKLPKIRPEDMSDELAAAEAPVSERPELLSQSQAFPDTPLPWSVKIVETEPELHSESRFRYRLGGVSGKHWQMTWQIDTFNKTRGPARYRVDGTFHDADGFVCSKQQSHSDIRVSPNETKTLRDVWRIPAEKAEATTEVHVTVQRRPGS